MSELSAAIERLAAESGAPVLEVQEYWAERASHREYDANMTREDAEIAAVEDVKIWIALWNTPGVRK
jgi:hypothetical protein